MAIPSSTLSLMLTTVLVLVLAFTIVHSYYARNYTSSYAHNRTCSHAHNNPYSHARARHVGWGSTAAAAFPKQHTSGLGQARTRSTSQLTPCPTL